MGTTSHTSTWLQPIIGSLFFSFSTMRGRRRESTRGGDVLPTAGWCQQPTTKQQKKNGEERETTFYDLPFILFFSYIAFFVCVLFCLVFFFFFWALFLNRGGGVWSFFFLVVESWHHHRRETEYIYTAKPNDRCWFECVAGVSCSIGDGIVFCVIISSKIFRTSTSSTLDFIRIFQRVNSQFISHYIIAIIM